MAKKPVPDDKKSRIELCQELIDLRVANRDAFDRMEALKSILKDRAKVDGSFRQEFPGIGFVSASPAKAESKIGDAPALVITAWDALKQPRRDRLLADGLVSIQAIMKGAYHGRAEVKLFARPT